MAACCSFAASPAPLHHLCLHCGQLPELTPAPPCPSTLQGLLLPQYHSAYWLGLALGPGARWPNFTWADPGLAPPKSAAAVGAALSKTAANMLLAAAMQDGLSVQDYMLPGGGSGGCPVAVLGLLVPLWLLSFWHPEPPPAAQLAIALSHSYPSTPMVTTLGHMSNSLLTSIHHTSIQNTAYQHK